MLKTTENVALRHAKITI